MRISTLHIFNIANKSMANANEAMIKTQEQLSSGVRVLSPSDDPVASTKIMQLTDELASIKQYERNIDGIQNNLVLEESALSSVSNLLQRMQELAVQAGNTATLSENEYKALAAEVDSRLDELVNLLNTQNASGDYIFGGYKSSSEPFTGNAASGFTYNGDAGQQFIKVANGTTLAASDSGKKIFMDIESSENTVRTYASPANKSTPPASISVGQVYDQEVYDEFYPEDIVITFNADNNILPAGKNFTATERSTGRVIAADQPFTPGGFIDLKGVRFRISGNPVSGMPAVPATKIFGSDLAVTYPQNFTAPANQTFTVNVHGRQETLVLDANITNTTDLASVLNNVGNGNAAKLASLGLTADSGGIQMPDGVNFSISNGSAAIDSVLGLNSTLGSSSNNGVAGKPGDRLFVDATDKQDILTTIAAFSEAMKSFDGSQERRDQVSEMIGRSLNNLSNTQTSILNTTSELGARFNTLDSTRGLHLDSQLVISEVLGQLRDIDYAETATILSAQSLVLQAAQSSFVRVSRLNLFSQL